MSSVLRFNTWQDAEGNLVADTSNGVVNVLMTETSEKTASYTPVLADAGYIVNMNELGAATFTVPTNANVAFPIGTIIGIYNQSASDVTVQGDTGVTVRNAGPVVQYAEASLRKRADNEWVMVG